MQEDMTEQEWFWRHSIEGGTKVLVLTGTLEGEHLRVEIGQEETVLISHELRQVRPTIQWKDRIMVVLGNQLLVQIAQLITSVDKWK